MAKYFIQKTKYKHQRTVIIGLILALAAFLRAYHLTHGIGFHPDERGIQMILSDLSWSNLNAKNFHYGSFAYYLCWFTGEFLNLFFNNANSYDFCFLIGRVYAVIFGVAAVFLTFYLVKLLTKDFFTSALTSFLLATNTFHLQLSRFYTVDILLTTIIIVALFACCKLIYDKKWNKLFAIFLGLAFTNKISALTLLAPYTVALFIRSKGDYSVRGKVKNIIKLLLEASLFFLITVMIVEPFFFLDFDKFVQDNNTQISMVKGLWVPPYTIQYIGTTPYLYHLEQIFYYTIGIPISILFVFGLIVLIYKNLKTINPSHCVIITWIFAVFISIGGYQVKFPRYLLPIYPALFFLAAYPIGLIPSLKFKKLISSVLIFYSLLQAFGWIKIYSTPHVYNTASSWIYENIKPGSVIANMHWDDRLPFDVSKYQNIEVNIYEDETKDRLAKVLESLSNADYIILPTAKMYNAIPKDPKRFPFTSRLIKALFEDKIGYSLLAKFKAYPLFHFDDSLADESLSIYDHPKVIILENKKHLNVDRIEEIVKNLMPLSSEELRQIQLR